MIDGEVRQKENEHLLLGFVLGGSEGKRRPAARTECQREERRGEAVCVSVDLFHNNHPFCLNYL